MYNKFSFYSIVVQTVAPEGSSATEGLKEMHIGIKIVTRLNDGQTMLGARAQASWSRPGGGEHVSLGVPAEPPHLPRPCCWWRRSLRTGSSSTRPGTTCTLYWCWSRPSACQLTSNQLNILGFHLSESGHIHSVAHCVGISHNEMLCSELILLISASSINFCEAQGKGRAKGRPRKVTQRSFKDGGWWISFPWCFTLNLVATTTQKSLNLQD